MSADESRLQRDRFVAFSFASTDLVFEVDAESLITFASGAAQELTGHGSQELIGKCWLSLFVDADQARLARTVDGLGAASRSGPIATRLTGVEQTSVGVVFSACRLPHREGFAYCTVSASNMARALQAPTAQHDATTGLLDGNSFSDAARDALEASAALGKSVELTLLDLSGTDFPDLSPEADGKDGFMSDLGSALRSRAVGGELAGQLAEGRFGIIHESDVDGAEIEQDILSLAKSFSPQADAVALDRGTLELGVAGLSQEEAGQALVYTINQFATARDGSITIDSLQAGFEELARETRTRITRLKSVVANRHFDLFLQPIVDLDSRDVRHYEMLLRFEKGQSPYPLITLAEGVGLIHELDMAVLNRSIEFLRDRSVDHRASVAVNISGRSISNDKFVDDLISTLLAHQSLCDRLLIEITESSQIPELEQVNKIVLALRGIGFAIGLDDFGAGAASFQYLRGLDVEFVKFDGAYVRSMLESERDLLMLKAMAGLCRDLDIRTIAEMIEQDKQAEKLQSLGIDLGQGYLFGRPDQASNYGLGRPSAPRETAGAPAAAKARYNPYTQAESSRPPPKRSRV